MDKQRLEQQLAFLLEIDKEKNILRQTHLSGHGRSENDAEHAWHMALCSAVLSEYAEGHPDPGHVLLLCLIHDLVEIDAGDTFAYDVEGTASQNEREQAAKERIFSLLPPDQKQLFSDLFDEFEATQTPEAKFARTMDNLQPFLLARSNHFSDWDGHAVTAERVLARQEKGKAGSSALWAYMNDTFTQEIARGHLKTENDLKKLREPAATLTTKRLVLRPWSLQDAEDLYALAKNPNIGPRAGWAVHTSVENSRDILRRALITKGSYAVTDKIDGKLIGSIAFHPRGDGQETSSDELEIGYWMGEPYQKKGYMSEAVREMQRHAFEDLGIRTLWCGYYAGNEASRRVQEKCGFIFDHLIENKYVPLLKEYRNEYFQKLTFDAWQAMQKDRLTILKNTEADNELLHEKIRAYNRQFVQQYKDYSFHLEEQGQIIAGITARSTMDTLEIEFLFVDEAHRGQKLGSKLLAHAEESAKADGCKRALVNTYSYQAPAFYTAHGYQQMLCINPCFGSFRQYYYVKDLTEDGTGLSEDLTFSDMQTMQDTLMKRYEKVWEPLTLSAGRNHLLWLMTELGEVIDILKKEGEHEVMHNQEVRRHFVEELGDVIMFFNDIMLCYQVSPDEFARIYKKKYQKNLYRWNPQTGSQEEQHHEDQ